MMKWMQWLACVFVFLIVIVTASATVQGDASGQVSAELYLPIVVVPLPPPPPPVIYPFGRATNLGNNYNITAITHAGDDRLFVAVQRGIIYVMEVAPDGMSGTALATPFLNISGSVQSIWDPDSNWEEGLLGLVFHPNYAANGQFFVSYTETDTHDIILARFNVSASDPNQADRNSYVELLRQPKPVFTNDTGEHIGLVHNAGALHFGPDGYLYMSIGDGGPDPTQVPNRPADIFNSGQRRDTLLGKILRIDVDRNDGSADCGVGNYAIPANNPFVDGPGGLCDEIWSYGWRNPWRFSFDTLTGDLFIGEVGEYVHDEIDVEPAGIGGRNYGWRCYQGTWQHTTECDGQMLTFPVYEYYIDDGTSVIGGFVYRGATYPSLYGLYLFTDFYDRTIQTLSAEYPNLPPKELIAADVTTPRWTTFGTDANGDIYLGGIYNPMIYKIIVPDN
ncbi:MAG: PQQ-dependent sugar dehydrogenase [Anaerolineae bacterium]|nr:PQQ-dependent sugar dehydrogenase [Anaerolineae bacterium]